MVTNFIKLKKRILEIFDPGAQIPGHLSWGKLKFRTANPQDRYFRSSALKKVTTGASGRFLHSTEPREPKLWGMISSAIMYYNLSQTGRLDWKLLAPGKKRGRINFVAAIDTWVKPLWRFVPVLIANPRKVILGPRREINWEWLMGYEWNLVGKTA